LRKEWYFLKSAGYAACKAECRNLIRHPFVTQFANPVRRLLTNRVFQPAASPG